MLKEKTSIGLWGNLEELYLTKFVTKQAILEHQLYTFCMVEGTSIKTYISKFNSCISNLSKLDAKISSKDQVILLLSSLPPSYKTFRDIILYCNLDQIDIENMKELLISKEQLVNKRNAFSHNDKSFALMVSNNQIGGFKSLNKDKSCSYHSSKL